VRFGSCSERRAVEDLRPARAVGRPRRRGSGASYGAATYERLKRLKRAYDSDKVFRLNQNIDPD
jgi:hypothetical protein